MAFKLENQAVVREFVEYLLGTIIVIALVAMMLTDRLPVEQFVAILGSLAALSHFLQGVDKRMAAKRNFMIRDMVYSQDKSFRPAPILTHQPPPTTPPHETTRHQAPPRTD